MKPGKWSRMTMTSRDLMRRGAAETRAHSTPPAAVAPMTTEKLEQMTAAAKAEEQRKIDALMAMTGGR